MRALGSRGKRIVGAMVAAAAFSCGPAVTASDPTEPAANSGSAELQSCEATTTDPWVRSLRDRIMQFDGLARYASERFGAVVSCRGRLTDRFDGLRFGDLELRFDGGARIDVSTYPPEASVVTLSVDTPFPDPSEIRRVVRSYVEDVGVDIDWSRSEVTREANDTTQVFVSPDPGFNASVRETLIGGRLVRVRFLLAP